MSETLTHDELVLAARSLMEEKGITVEDLEEQGWGAPETLPEDELADTITWLSDFRKKPQTIARTDVQQQMIDEARAAGRLASDAQADPAVKRGYLYEKRIGRYRVTVEEDTKIQKEGRVQIVGTVWLGQAKLHSEWENVSESALEGKVKQLAHKLTERKVRSR